MKTIPFYKISVDDKELNNIQKLLSSNSHNLVQELEEEICDFIGAKYCIATANPTLALHLAYSAMDIKRADKVVMSINSFVNEAESLRHFDAEPIFIDTDKEGLNIDLDKLDQYLANNKSKKLRAVVVNFVSGKLVDLDKLYQIKKKYNIILIEDATSAFGAMYKNQMVGNLEADMTVFSLDANYGSKSIANSGFIVTNNEKLATRARLLRNHAIKSSFDSYGNLDYIYDVVDIGYKFDMSELEASYNLAQFYKTNDFIQKRQEIVQIYIDELNKVKHIQVPSYDEEHIYTQFIIKIDKNRDGFARELKAKGISTRLHYIPLHLLTYYKQKYKLKITDFPNVLNSYSQILSLPIYPSMSVDDVKYVCDSIKEVANRWV